MAQLPQVSSPKETAVIPNGYELSRIDLLRSVLPACTATDAIIDGVAETGLIPDGLTAHFPAAAEKASLAISLGSVTENNPTAVKQLIARPDINNLRDAALHLGSEEISVLAANVERDGGPTINVRKMCSELFQREPSGVIQRMVASNEIRLPPGVRRGVTTFLQRNQDFNFRQASLLSVQLAAQLGDIPERDQVFKSLVTIQRVQALTPQPTALSVLLNAGVSSAYQVAQLPESKFVELFKDGIGSTSAAAIHDHATAVAFRNESALLQLWQTVKGTGVSAIDGPSSLSMRMTAFKEQAAVNKYSVNFEQLFGGLDYCECDECSSVFSPANYYVELLQYLLNNTLDASVAEDGQPLFPQTIDPSYDKTALHVLLKRRPDLQHLQLTCENANTLIPYVDLVNEIMESFVVHQNSNPVEWSPLAQFAIDAFNVTDETSSELQAAPQHTSQEAYAIIRNAVFPLTTLPFHQSLTAMRIYLRFLKTSRAELMQIFRSPYSPPPGESTFSEAEKIELEKLHHERQERALSAEYLNINPEEYVILTEEAFEPKRYYEITLRKPDMTEEYYRLLTAQWRAPHDFWGYSSEEEMLNTDDEREIGLQYVKKQLLPRAGLTYAHIVELLQTVYVNPHYPTGRDLLLMQSIKSSYRFLQSLVDETRGADKYKQLLHYLDRNVPRFTRAEWAVFVDDWFERLGKVIVLESDQGPTLPVHGTVLQWSPGTIGADESDRVVALGKWAEDLSLVGVQRVGTLYPNGWITDNQLGDGTLYPSGTLLGFIDEKGIGQAAAVGSLFTDGGFNDKYLITQSYTEMGVAYRRVVAYISKSDLTLRWWDSATNSGELVNWASQPKSDMLDSVRLVHLDGTYLDSHEWNRMQRFIRLKARSGLSINEMDKAIVGLSQDISSAPLNENATAGGFVGKFEINPLLLTQLAGVKRLQEATGASYLKLLTLFSDISTVGNDSAYKQLFLPHSLVRMDPVFVPDDHGNILAKPTKIADHLNVLLTAFHLKSPQLNAIITYAKLEEANLTLRTVSQLWRYVLLANILNVKPEALIQAMRLFDFSPTTAGGTLEFVNGVKAITTSLDIPQLAFVVRNEDPDAKFTPSKLQVVKTAATILEGLAAIKVEQPVFPDSTDPTYDDVNKFLGLVYPPDLVVKILAFIDGTSNQDSHFFDIYLAEMFQDSASARRYLATDSTWSVAEKRRYLLKHHVPHVRQVLAEKLVVESMAGVVGAVGPQSLETVRLLLADIFKVPDPVGLTTSALRSLSNLDYYSPLPTHWTGHLVPPTSDMYSFVRLGREKPDKAILLDGVSKSFDRKETKPSEGWSTMPIELVGGRLYEVKFEAPGPETQTLLWRTPRTLAAPIPGTSMISSAVSRAVKEVLQKLVKANVCIQGLGLTYDEITYFHSVTGEAAFGFTLDTPAFSELQRVWAYCDLRSSVSAETNGLINLFTWASSEFPEDKTPTPLEIAEHVEVATKWPTQEITELIGADGWRLVRGSDFTNERNLRRIQAALQLSHKVAIRPSQLFEWVSRTVPYFDDISADIQKTIQSRYSSAEEWEQAARPIHNELRLAQRDALVAYLLVHPSLKLYGILDADTLFEFFLIDVQMGACLQTSRLKQAISTVQQFVQRCILGLEEQRYPHIHNTSLDQGRWKWMSKQTVWTANRKVFLHPEAYLEPSLRDDRSDLYRAMESEVEQKDLNPESVQDALKNYLFGLSQRGDLLIQGVYDNNSWNESDRVIRFVARTRVSPYVWFYRAFSYDAHSWTPWMEVPIDIPVYTAGPVKAEDGAEIPAVTGSFVIPAVLGTRSFILFGVLNQTRTGDPTEDDELLIPGSGLKASDLKKVSHSLARLQTWELRLGWTELRNGKWSPKQISVDAIIDNDAGLEPPNMDFYRFVPFFEKDLVLISVYNPRGRGIGSFEFHGNYPFFASQDTLKTLTTSPPDNISSSIPLSFHLAHSPRTRGVLSKYATMYSVQNLALGPVAGGPFAGSVDLTLGNKSHVRYLPNTESSEVVLRLGVETQVQSFSHNFAHSLLIEINRTDSLGSFFNRLNAEFHMTREPFGYTDLLSTLHPVPTFNELYHPYSLYNWELGYHIPMALADMLFKSQKFEAAFESCHLIFDPYADGDSAQRVWKWKPFTEMDTSSMLTALFKKLQPHTADNPSGPINQWRNDPFAPHVVARGRPVAYMKATVMKYLEILIAYGDWYFRQGSMEVLPQALQLYVLASQLCGPSPQKVPEQGKREPQTYFSLLRRWDAFSNASVDMELAFPFSNQEPLLGHDVRFVPANIFGLATTHYFSVPENPQLRTIRETIDQRLYNVRHCLDINGKSMSYPLWDPPIDPSILVATISQGLGLPSVLNEVNSPMPNYRFSYILHNAIELCSELKTSSSLFLSIKERRDSEALTVLRSRQERDLHNMTMQIRKLQLDEANKNLEALRDGRNEPLSRYKLYSSLAGTPMLDLAESNVEYKEIELQVEKPSTEGDLVLSASEKRDLTEAAEAKDIHKSAAAVELIAANLLLLPKINCNASPWGVGITIGGLPENIANSMTTGARALQIKADDHSFNALQSAKKAGYRRQMQERVHQANAAGYGLVNINKQIMTQSERIKIAEQEIVNQQKMIDTAQETLDFLTTKYTNDELYAYLENSVRATLYQTYTLAYDLAKKAEATYVFERGPQAAKQPFIKFGYWDPRRDGLQCGDALYLSLKRLEVAHMEEQAHNYEISKTVSLRQLAPRDLMQVRATGVCDFILPEVLFDMDFPGHYMRRIKSVSVSVPCVVGPYTSVNATLSLLTHRYRVQPTETNSYAEKREGDVRFTTSKVPITSIAVSNGQNDPGLFELSFASDRYLPFEGAGAISEWKLELPDEMRAFDYGSISDILLHIRYTSLDGGALLKSAAKESVRAFAASVASLSQREGLTALLDLQAEFSSEWSQAVAAADLPLRALVLRNLADRLPFYTRGWNPLAQDVTILTETEDVTASQFFLASAGREANEEFSFSNADAVGALKSFRTDEQIGLPIIGPGWRLEIRDGERLVLKKIWLLVRFTLS